MADISGLIVDLDIEVISGSSGLMVDLHIEGYSFSPMCWMFAVFILIAFTNMQIWLVQP